MAQSNNAVTLFLVLLTPRLFSCTQQVDYSYKITSDKRGDLFGLSLATSFLRLVVGAPGDRKFTGSVSVEHGSKLTAPQGSYFGRNVAVNQNFIVITGERPYTVYVYDGNYPYHLKAQIPLDQGLFPGAVELTEDNAIAVATYNRARAFVTIYKYDGNYSWELMQKITLDDWKDIGNKLFVSLTISANTLAIGYRGTSAENGAVIIYQKQNEKWISSQRLQPFEQVDYFGISIALEGNHLAVSSYGGKSEQNSIFTYARHSTNGTWFTDGKLVTPKNRYGFSQVSLHKGVLAATVNDREKHPEVCAMIYKLSEKLDNSSNNGDGEVHNSDLSNTKQFDAMFSNRKYGWERHSTLMTPGEGLKSDGIHSSVKVQDGLVFTGRVSTNGDEVGVVYVHRV